MSLEKRFHYLISVVKRITTIFCIRLHLEIQSVLVGILRLLKKEELLFQVFAATAVGPQGLHRLELALAEQADEYCLLGALGILLSIPVIIIVDLR